MRISKLFFLLVITLVILFGLTGCPTLPENTANGDGNAADVQPPDDDPVLPPDEPEETELPPPTEAPTEAPPPEPDFDPLPAERQAIEIETSDGRKLEGFYYPAKVDNAPVVVMMHWAGGSMDEDWFVLAPWLQNRLDELAFGPSGKGVRGLANPSALMPWQDGSWFPILPVNASFALVTFNFGSWGNSEGSHDGWLEDALSAVKFAASLAGIDPNRISTIGASIGADGAVDACYMFNLLGLGTCIGAFSLSPGNYLTDDFTYAEAAAALTQAGYPVWCLASTGDAPAADTCRTGSGENYQIFIYAGGDHGMTLVTPDHMPTDPAMDENTLELYLLHLEEVYGLELIE